MNRMFRMIRVKWYRSWVSLIGRSPTVSCSKTGYFSGTMKTSQTWVVSLFLLSHPQLSPLGNFPHGHQMATTAPDITSLPTHAQKNKEDLILSFPAWPGNFSQQMSSDDPPDRSWASLAAREASMYMFFTFSCYGGRRLCHLGRGRRKERQ